MNRDLHEFFSIEVQHLHVLHVFERLLLLCPYASAREHLHAAIEEAAFSGLDVGAAVRFEPGSDPLGSYQPWNVYWTAGPGSLQPDFAGSMTVQMDGSYRGAVLEISGDCVPSQDAAFDVEAAGVLASITARALLTQIASMMERRYKETVFLT